MINCRVLACVALWSVGKVAKKLELKKKRFKLPAGSWQIFMRKRGAAMFHSAKHE